MKEVLEQAKNDGELRGILTHPDLLNEKPSGRHVNIAWAANRYTKMFFGLPIKSYVVNLRKGIEIPQIPPDYRRLKNRYSKSDLAPSVSPQTNYVRVSSKEFIDRIKLQRRNKAV